MSTASPGVPTARQKRADAINAMFAKPPDSLGIDERSAQNAVKHYLSNVEPPLELSAPERVERLFRDYCDDLKPTDTIELTLIRNMARCAVRLDLHEEGSYSALMADKSNRLIHWENQRQANLLPIISRFDAPVLISKALFQRMTSTLNGARLVLSRMDNCVDWVRENKLFDEPFKIRIMNAFGICTPEDLEALLEGWPNLAELFLYRSKLAQPSRPPAALYEELLDFMKIARQALKDQGAELDVSDRETRRHFEKSLEVEHDPAQAAIWNRYLTSAERGYFRNLSTLNSFRKQKREEAEIQQEAEVEVEAEIVQPVRSEMVSASELKRQPKLSRDQRRALRRRNKKTRRQEAPPRPQPSEQVSMTSVPEPGFVSQAEGTGLDEFLKPGDGDASARSTVSAQEDRAPVTGPSGVASEDRRDAQVCVSHGIVATPPPDPLGKSPG